MNYKVIQKAAALCTTAALALCQAGCAAGAEGPGAAGSALPPNSLAAQAQNYTLPPDITPGTETQRGFLNDNVLHSEEVDIHYSSYIPTDYDGSQPYALFITLPGWEGLYFQGVGANMVEDFGTEAPRYNDRMIVLSPS